VPAGDSDSASAASAELARSAAPSGRSEGGEAEGGEAEGGEAALPRPPSPPRAAPPGGDAPPGGEGGGCLAEERSDKEAVRWYAVDECAEELTSDAEEAPTKQTLPLPPGYFPPPPAPARQPKKRERQGTLPFSASGTASLSGAAARLSAYDKVERGVAQLVAMGFGESAARGALRHSAANLQAAVERLCGLAPG